MAGTETAAPDVPSAQPSGPPSGPSGNGLAGPEGILRRQSLREPAARTYARSLPIVPVRARGLTIEGADGRRYLDCLSGAGTLALGHNHPVVLEAIKRVIDSEAPLHASDLASPVKDAFTTELFAALPEAFARDARIQFCGPADADALGAALALVRSATGRDGLLTFAGARQSTPYGSLRVTRLPYPRDYRSPFGTGGVRGAELAVRWTEELLNDAEGPEPAAMLVEPLQCEGGVLPAPDGWLRRMRALTEARSIPLVADEIDTGVGRTGAFWAVGPSGIVPDVLVLSKAVGGSLPLSVIVYRSALDEPRETGPGGGRQASRGNQLAMAAGAATLAYVRENRLDEHAATLGARMLGRLREETAALPCVGDVRGRGLMIGVELTEPAQAAAVRQECLNRGLIVDVCGRHPGVVRLLPPLTLTEEQAAAVLDRFAEALAAVERAAETLG
ncbi:aminotransferase class III-fold pyridoxal phosphate-dependent enzyme [Streptomyces sp. MUM 203J]|uniref:aminotransferase class III-fold pyridoxal phosphate-dependent enzyme n=1 Tax=Streptomyces sp. MUM 203J TaxID=2791990 RepID=UPI0035AC012C|nr:aminotransferase class III-fold pyridoxal phosphate-dependent enzyme [Streptomyces sp. MUM 203J]